MSVKIPKIFLVVVILFLTACYSNRECPRCQIGGKDGDPESPLPREEDQEQREEQKPEEIPATPEGAGRRFPPMGISGRPPVSSGEQKEGPSTGEQRRIPPPRRAVEQREVPLVGSVGGRHGPPPAGDQHPPTTQREVPPTVEEWSGVPLEEVRLIPPPVVKLVPPEVVDMISPDLVDEPVLPGPGSESFSPERAGRRFPPMGISGRPPVSSGEQKEVPSTGEQRMIPPPRRVVEQREEQKPEEIPATPEGAGRRFSPMGISGRPPVSSGEQKEAPPTTGEQQQAPVECPAEVPEEGQAAPPTEEVLELLRFQWDNLDELEDRFKQLECQDCPPSFGHLIRKIDLPHDGETLTFTKRCQGSLIDEDLFLTARHCLPSYLSPGDSCEDVKVILPQISHDKPMEILDCDQLIRVSRTYEGLPKENFQPDWAIIKLKSKSPGRFLKPDTDNARGISDNESLFAFSTLENPGTGEVSIARIKCQAIQNSLSLPEFNDDLSPLALLQCDHPLGSGFSGMTLFQKGEDQQYFPVGNHSHSLGKESERRSVISQVICMGEGEEPEFCEFDPDKKEDHIKRIYTKTLKKSKVEIDEEFRHLIGDENNPIQWRQVNSENWRNMPKSYVSRFNSEIERFEEKIGEETMMYYMQHEIPVYPKCIRRNFVSDRGRIETSVQIPMTEIALTKTEDRKVDTYYKITYLEAKLLLGSDDTEEIENGFASPEDWKFIVRFTSERPSPKYPENPKIIYGRFSHNPAVIPLCPKNQDFQGIH